AGAAARATGPGDAVGNLLPAGEERRAVGHGQALPGLVVDVGLVGAGRHRLRGAVVLALHGGLRDQGAGVGAAETRGDLVTGLVAQRAGVPGAGTAAAAAVNNQRAEQHGHEQTTYNGKGFGRHALSSRKKFGEQGITIPSMSSGSLASRHVRFAATLMGV